jgi:type IV pilus assembly protein PilQ
MRKIKKVVSTGCFFLCLGGWVYNGQLRAADEVNGGREAAMTNAVAQAAAPGALEAAPSNIGPAFAQAAPPAAEQVRPAAAASAPAGNGDLTKPIVIKGVDDRYPQVTFSEAPIQQALRFFAEQSKKNIITSQNVKGSVTINLYDVSLTEALDSMLKPNGFDYIEKGNFIYVYTAQEIVDINKRDRKTISRVYHLKYMNAQDAQILLKPMLSSVGQIAMTGAASTGIESGSSSGGGGGSAGGMSLATDDTLVISDFPENLDDVTSKLRELDVRPKQVLIEATVLDASLKDDNALGVDMVSLSGLNFGDIGSLISPVSGSASTSDSSSSSTVSTPGQLAGTLDPSLSQKQVNAGTNFAKNVPDGGLSIGFLSNHVSVYLRALESVTDTTVVANPKILALNKQKGEVHIGQRLGYLTTSTSQTTTQQVVQFLDVGTKLIFRPFIAEDGYIRMEIHPENSSGALDSRGVPQTSTTEVTSNVMIRDGRTIVIGGLFSESTSASRGQVPVLGNIPVLGAAFRSTNDGTTRQETIILITPHIINDDTALYDESLREQEDVQRMMLGNRAGLQPWGRDRIAHMWLAKAQEEAAKGSNDKALMYADWAINSNPRLLEAIRLREQLTGRKMDEKTGISVADLVKNVLKGDAPTTPDKGGAGVYPPATSPAEKK